MKGIKILSSAVAAGLALTSLTACNLSGNGTDSSDASVSSSETSETLERIRLTEGVDEMPIVDAAPEVAQISEPYVTDKDYFEVVSSSDAQGYSVEQIIYHGDNQTYANTFLTNFTEQCFNSNPDDGVFGTDSAKIEDLLKFVFYHIVINDYSELKFEKKGKVEYAVIPFEKADSLIVKYFARKISADECKLLSAPPSKENSDIGPYYENGKLYFFADGAGRGGIYNDIAVVDYAVNTGNGLLELHFTVYRINKDDYLSLDKTALKKYYTLTPSEAANDKTLTKCGTGIATVDCGQNDNYYLKYYEVKMG